MQVAWGFLQQVIIIAEDQRAVGPVQFQRGTLMMHCGYGSRLKGLEIRMVLFTTELARCNEWQIDLENIINTFCI